MTPPKYILTEDTIVVRFNNSSINIISSDSRFKPVRNFILSESWKELIDFLDTKEKAKTFGITEPEKIETAHAGIQKLIVEQPASHLRAFNESCSRNPNPQSVKELYDFLKHAGFAITSRGSFLTWKSVRENFTDHHTGKFDHKPGMVIEMDRELCDTNRHQTCSTGFHSATYNYAANTMPSGKLLVMEIFPEHVTSVPSDYNFEKLRCCKYKVIAVYDKKRTPEEFIDKIARDIEKNEARKGNVKQSAPVTKQKTTVAKFDQSTKRVCSVSDIADYALKLKAQKKGVKYIHDMIVRKFKDLRDPIKELKSFANKNVCDRAQKDIFNKICEA